MADPHVVPIPLQLKDVQDIQNITNQKVLALDAQGKVVSIPTNLFDQDNIKTQILIDFPPAPSVEMFTDVINQLPTFIINSQSILTFKSISTDLNPATYYIELIGIGKGTYGVGGVDILPENLKITSFSSSSTDIASISSTQMIDLGYQGDDIVTSLNRQSPNIDIQDQNDGYVIITGVFQNGEYHEYLWLGIAGSYGNGGLQSIPENFKELSAVSSGIARATSDYSGTVKTDTTQPDPTVYVKETVDTLLNSKVDLVGGEIPLVQIPSDVVNVDSKPLSFIAKEIVENNLSYKYITRLDSEVLAVTYVYGDKAISYYLRKTVSSVYMWIGTIYRSGIDANGKAVAPFTMLTTNVQEFAIRYRKSGTSDNDWWFPFHGVGASTQTTLLSSYLDIDGVKYADFLELPLNESYRFDKIYLNQKIGSKYVGTDPTYQIIVDIVTSFDDKQLHFTNEYLINEDVDINRAYGSRASMDTSTSATIDNGSVFNNDFSNGITILGDKVYSAKLDGPDIIAINEVDNLKTNINQGENFASDSNRMTLWNRTLGQTLYWNLTPFLADDVFTPIEAGTIFKSGNNVMYLPKVFSANVLPTTMPVSLGLARKYDLGIRKRIVPYSGVSKTIGQADLNTVIVTSNVNPVVITIPTNVTTPLPIGFEFDVTQEAAGAVTVGGSGVSFISDCGNVSVQGETRTYTKTDTNTWSVEGKLKTIESVLENSQNPVSSGAVYNVLSQKQSVFSGIANYITKSINSTTLGVSRLFDDGNFFGIGTSKNPTKHITLGNQGDKIFGIEESNSVTAGRKLTIEAGRTINYASSFFVETAQQLPFKLIAADPNGDIWGLVNEGSPYKKPNGLNLFEIQGLGIPTYSNVGNTFSINMNGDMFLIVNNQIHARFNRTGNFTNTGISANHVAASHTSADVYYALNGVGVYKLISGAGSGILQTSPVANYSCLAYANNNDVYLCISSSFYKQTNATGSFSYVSSSPEGNTTIGISHSNNLYVASVSGNIYIQYNCSGAFILFQYLNMPNNGSFAFDINTDVYLGSYNSGRGIYAQQNLAVGTDNLNGGDLELKAGTGKGTGESRVKFFTGNKAASGTDMQSEILREYIDENGYHVCLSMPVYVDNAAASAAGLPVGTQYRTTLGILMIRY